VNVVPVVIDHHVLLALIALFDSGGCGEPVLGLGVIAGPEVDVAGHVNHVSGSWSKAGEERRTVYRLLRMRAGFDRVNPVVVRRGVIGRNFEHLLNQRDVFLLPLLWLAVVVVAVAQCAGEKEFGLQVAGRILHQLAPDGDLLCVVGIVAGLGCLRSII
jgi:hypothetical protein